MSLLRRPPTTLIQDNLFLAFIDYHSILINFSSAILLLQETQSSCLGALMSLQQAPMKLQSSRRMPRRRSWVPSHDASNHRGTTTSMGRSLTRFIPLVIPPFIKVDAASGIEGLA